MEPFQNSQVEAKFAAYPTPIRSRLLALRSLILRTAAATQGVGRLDETLKWGEPAYVTAESGAGSTIRIDWKQSKPTEYAMYFNCNTTLVDTFRSLFPNDFSFEGNRALVFRENETLPEGTLAFCIAAALTYHLRKVVLLASASG